VTCGWNKGDVRVGQRWVDLETMVWSRPHEGNVWVGWYTDEDDVRVGWSAIKGDVRAWCETDKGSVHKARWGVGKRCQVARGIGAWTADVHC
jgi:hypothetical protein